MKTNEHPLSDDRGSFSEIRRRLAALTLITGCLALNVCQARVVGMHQVVSFWAAQAVPAALGNLCFDQPHDYRGLVGVRDLFGVVPWQPTAQGVNDGIENVLAHRHEPIDRTWYLVSPDDKGIIDFVELAFVLFGYRAESLLPLYWAGLAASCLVFWLRFGGRPWAVALLVAFLLAHCCALPVIAINPQLRSVLALRFMSLWGVVATLHLVLETRSGESLWPVRWLGVAYQTAMILFVLHIRFSAIWEVLCVAGVAATVAFRLWRQDGLGKRLLAAAVPAVLLLAGTCGLSAYKRSAISRAYYSGGGASHVFWHSVFSGLAFSPVLGPKFGIGIDDVSIYDCTHRFLVERGQGRRWEKMGRSEQRYDQAVRDMFFTTCLEYPREVFSTYVYHKPRALVLYIAWLMRLADDPPDVQVLWTRANEELDGITARMDRYDRSFRLFRPGCFVLLLLTLLWAHRSVRAHMRDVAAAFVPLAACSLMPSLLGYPTSHTINDALVCFGMLTYLVVLAAAGAVLARVRQAHGCRAGGHAACALERAA